MICLVEKDETLVGRVDIPLEYSRDMCPYAIEDSCGQVSDTTFFDLCMGGKKKYSNCELYQLKLDYDL
jgi:hypothetical protein